MKAFLLAAAAAAAALISTPALAQATHPAGNAAQADAAPTHEMCKSVMGRAMAGKPVHDHGRDKTGAVTWPNGKPLTAAEMDKMHRKCAEKMQMGPASAAH